MLGPDGAKCGTLAREQVRWAANCKVVGELPYPVNFDAYSQFVRAEAIA